MKQDQITIGMQARVKIGSRLAPVTVERVITRHGRRTQYQCLTADTGRRITATAARLRPLVDAPRPVAAAKPAAGPVDFSGPTGDEWLPFVRVPGLLPRGGEGRVIRLSGANHALVRRVVDREHVAESFGRIARVVRAAIGRHTRWQSIPRDLRRGVLFTAACIHHGNRERYTAVMGHAPLPSPRAIAEAVGIAVGLGREPIC